MGEGLEAGDAPDLREAHRANEEVVRGALTQVREGLPTGGGAMALTGPLRSKNVGSSSNGCDERLVSVAPFDLVADAEFPHDDLQDLAFPGRGADVDGVDDDPVTALGSCCG